MELSVQLRCSSPVPVVAVGGELDLESGPCLAECLRSLLQARGPVLALDLAGVRFIDCAGVGALVASGRAARQGGAGQAWPRKPVSVLGENASAPGALPARSSSMGHVAVGADDGASPAGGRPGPPGRERGRPRGIAAQVAGELPELRRQARRGSDVHAR